MGLFDNSIQSYSEQALDAAWYKQQVISNNIANSSTPDYKAKTVEFGLILKEAKCKCKYHTPDEDGESRVSFSVSTTYETNTNQLLNGNNVDMEKEALDLADVQYQYSALMDQMNNNYAMIRTAITK
ncbi:MAG: flagellar basal body rod protein FlgB [Oscillospiraceae bacterium]|nr:flagellar basal body rod protein FlgB [Oscillospiraceae bacterium]